MLALQDLLRWSHPKVTVLEIPDLDDGTPAYEDECIRVWAVGKPSVPWQGPCTLTIDKHMPDSGQAGSPETSSASSESASASDSSEDAAELENGAGVSPAAGAAMPDSITQSNAPPPREHATMPAIGTESSSDDSSDSDCEGDPQMQVFGKIDSVLAARGSASEVFAAMMQASRKPSESAALKRRRDDDAIQHALPVKHQETEAVLLDAAQLQSVPKRGHHGGVQRAGWDAVTEPKSSVRIARNAAGSIGKHADGAAAFVVFVKHSCRWLLLNFAAEVPRCSMHHVCSSSTDHRLQPWHSDLRLLCERTAVYVCAFKPP